MTTGSSELSRVKGHSNATTSAAIPAAPSHRNNSSMRRLRFLASSASSPPSVPGSSTSATGSSDRPGMRAASTVARPEAPPVVPPGPDGPLDADPVMSVCAQTSWIRSNVCLRRAAGAGMNSGAPPSSATGFTILPRCSRQPGQVSIWRAMRLRIRMVNSPSQSERNSPNSAHPCPVRARRATSSAPSDRSMVSRSRCVMVRAPAALTPRASASSGPSRPCR